MIKSEKHKLLFIHIQKTGGSSIAELMYETFPDSVQYLNKHDHAISSKLKMGDEWDDFYKFAFVRNPWERLVSWYSMIMQQKEKLVHNRNKMWEYVIANSVDFPSFVKNCTSIIDDFDGRKCFFFNQLDYLLDSNENLIVNFVGRFENFDYDIQQLFKQIDVPLVQLPCRNSSIHTHYSKYYDNETKLLVRQKFIRDIEFFGYSFEDIR